MIGEEVAAWDQGNLKVLSTGEPDLKWRRVTGKFERQAPGVMHMTVRSGEVRETITVTPNHPYLRPSDVIGKGVLELVNMDPGGDWTAVLKLRPGDELVSAFGVPLVVDSIDVDDAPTRVYSLEVEGLHSFAVGELAAWVHNARGPSRPGPVPGAQGPHTPFPTRPGGGTASWYPNANCPCGWEILFEYDFDPKSKPHYDKASKCKIPAPHVYDRRTKKTSPL